MSIYTIYIYILRYVAARHVNTQDLQVKESGSFVRKNRVSKIGFDQCDSELSMTPALRTSTLPRLPAAACSRLDLYLAWKQWKHRKTVLMQQRFEKDWAVNSTQNQRRTLGQVVTWYHGLNRLFIWYAHVSSLTTLKNLKHVDKRHHEKHGHVWCSKRQKQPSTLPHISWHSHRNKASPPVAIQWSFTHRSQTQWQLTQHKSAVYMIYWSA